MNQCLHIRQKVQKFSVTSIKCLSWLGGSFVLASCAYRGVASLQSSVNPSGLGTASLAGTAAIFCGTLALMSSMREMVHHFMNKIGLKFCLVLSVVLSSTYILAQSTLQVVLPENFNENKVIFPFSKESQDDYALCIILTSVAVGIGWAMFIFCTLRHFSDITKDFPELNIYLIWLFLALWKLATMFGNMISSIVLSTSGSENNDVNISYVSKFCGMNFWPGNKFVIDNAVSNLNRPTSPYMNWISGVYLGFMVLSGCCVVIGVENSSCCKNNVETDNVTNNSPQSNAQFECEEDKLKLVSRRMVLETTTLLAPLALSLGLAQAFIEADFSSGFIACVLGMKYIGWVMACQSLTEGVGILLALFMLVREQSQASRSTRVTVTISATLLQLGFFISLVAYGPPTFNTLFGGVAASGLGTGVLLVVLTDDKNTCFATLAVRLLGLVVGYVYSAHLDMRVKLHILEATTILGLLGYMSTTFRTGLQTRHKSKEMHPSNL